MHSWKAVLLVAILVATTRADDGPLVDTDCGPVQGKIVKGAREFLGIPYAAPPTGDLRFAPAAKPVCWGPSVHDGTVFGPGCIQTHHNEDVPKNQSEDCLSLNVFAPAAASNETFPVMVFLHGGGFAEGGSSLFFYDGTFLASNRDVVVVTINYRLGALGFLTTRDLSGNYGLTDQIAALEWVQRNIAAFGGRADAVTVWGESAGAMSIGILMMTTKAKGLFQRAIMESNPFGFQYKTKRDADDYGRSYAKFVGCGERDVGCLRSSNVTEVIYGTKKAGAAALPWIEQGVHVDNFLEWVPTVDGSELVPEQPLDAFHAQRLANPVPLLIGTNADEGATFVLAGLKSPINHLEYDGAVVGLFRWSAFKILKDFPAKNYGHDGRMALGDVLTKYWFSCPSRRSALDIRRAGLAAFVYKYDHHLSFDPFVHALPFCADLVCHASELPLVFHALGPFHFDAEEEQLSGDITRYWANFAHSGNPNNGPFSPPVTWPIYDSSKPEAITFNYNVTVASAANKDCDMFDEIGYKF